MLLLLTYNYAVGCVLNSMFVTITEPKMGQSSYIYKSKTSQCLTLMTYLIKKAIFLLLTCNYAVECVMM